MELLEAIVFPEQTDQTKTESFTLMLLNQINVNEDECFISLDVGDPSLSELV